MEENLTCGIRPELLPRFAAQALKPFKERNGMIKRKTILASTRTTLLVKKSNSLIEAAFQLTLGEHRILLSCIALAQRGDGIDDQTLYPVKAVDIAEMAEITRQTAYEELEKASKILDSRRVLVMHGPEGRKPDTRRFPWIQDLNHSPSRGLIELRFTSAILPYLQDLSKRYTVYDIRDVARMTSAYGIRLYELLVQWRNAGQCREIEVAWLRKAFQLEDQYPALADLKRYVIQVAVDQVNEHTPLNVSWDQRKVGRTVTHFLFRIEAKAKKPAKQVKPRDPERPAPITAAELARLAYPGESERGALARLNRVLVKRS